MTEPTGPLSRNQINQLLHVLTFVITACTPESEGQTINAFARGFTIKQLRAIKQTLEKV